MDWLRYVRIALLTGLFILPFTVLIVADWLYFPFITGKNFFFRVVVEIVFALWVILALYAREYRPRKSAALVLAGVFLLWMAVATVLAENPIKAFWSNFERMEGFITLLHLGALVTVLTSVLKSEELWQRFFQVSLGAALIVGVYALFQLGGAFTINQGGVRVDGTLGNATYFAIYMAIHAFIALYGLVHWARNLRWLQALYGGLFVLNAVLVFYSATRGSILGLIGGLLLSGLIFLFGAEGTLRKVGIGLIAVIIVVSGAFFAVKDATFVREHPVLERIASISLESGTVRFTIWDMAFQGALERPLFGWGQEGFNYIFNKYYQPSLVTQEPWFDRAHNVMLDWMVAGGFPAMLLYLSLYLVLLWYLWRPGNSFSVSERALLTGLIAAYGFHNLFVFDNLMSYLMFAMLFSYITVRSEKTPDAQAAQPLLQPETASIATPLVALALVAVLYVANGSGYATAAGIIQGISPQPEGVQKNLEYLIVASERGGLGHQEVGEQFLQFALKVRELNVGDQGFQLSAAQAARTAFLGVLEEAPDDARLLVFFGSFLRQFGDLAGARAELERALALSPKKQSILLEKGMLEYSEEKYQDAFNTFGSVFASAPDFAGTRILYAASAILAGEDAVASQVLQEKYGTDEVADTTIIQAHLKAGNHATAIRIAEGVVADDPQNLDKLKFLAGVYLSVGQPGGAISTLRRAIEAHPEFRIEGEELIREISAGR